MDYIFFYMEANHVHHSHKLLHIPLRPDHPTSSHSPADTPYDTPAVSSPPSPRAHPNSGHLRTLLQLMLEAPSHRSVQDCRFSAEIMKEENLFPEFHNNITVLTRIAQLMRGRLLTPGESLLEVGNKERNMYKLVAGMAKVTRNGQSRLKGRNQFIETSEECRQLEEVEVNCEQECHFLVLSPLDYEEFGRIYMEHKRVRQMLCQTSLLSSLKRKEMAFLCQDAQLLEVGSKECVFAEGDFSNQLFYFIIEGEVAINKKDLSNKLHFVSYVSNGGIFGDEVLFGQERRCYSAVVHSSRVRLMALNLCRLQATVDTFKLGRGVLTDSYQNYLSVKEEHYCLKVQQNLRVQHSFHQTNKPSKMTPLKQQQMGNLLREIENNVEKLYQKERKLEKRSNYDKDKPVNGNKISVENPLFGKDCFPTLRKPPKLSKGNEGCGRLGCRLPQLH